MNSLYIQLLFAKVVCQNQNSSVLLSSCGCQLGISNPRPKSANYKLAPATASFRPNPDLYDNYF